MFGVRGGLVLPFKQATDRAELPANLAARDTLPMPVWTATLDLKLPAVSPREGVPHLAPISPERHQ